MDELCAHVAEAAGLNYETVPDGQSRSLYAHRLPAEAAGTVTVVRLTGGSGAGFRPDERVQIQCRTRAATEREALLRAGAIAAVFRDPERLPTRNLDLTTWRLIRIDADQPPSTLGVLDGGVEVSFNWSVAAVPTS